MANVGAYLSYFAAAVATLVAGIAAYALLTPYKELTLIRAGNTAAAYSLGGTALGLSVAIASAVAHSVGFIDMLLWAAIASVAQFAVYAVVAMLLPGLKDAIVADKVGNGIFLGAMSLAVGVLNAASLTW